MPRIRRPFPLVLAATLIIGFSVAFCLWLGQADTLAARLTHAWHAVRSDWLVAVMLADAAVFVALGLVWLWHDAGAQLWTRRRRIAWIIATLIVGSPALLVYVAIRPTSAAPRSLVAD